MKGPDFFIVGAPKCGTTSLNDYLHAHPDIYMAKKELHFFGTDLGIIQEKMNRNKYLEYFSKGQNAALRGESSAWYLFSELAAGEIHQFNPKAKIIIMLRNPVEMIRSLHRQFIFDLDESVTDFEQAIALEDARALGNHLPDSKNFKVIPSYIKSALYAPQIRRYLDVFGRSSLHFIFFDQLVAETARVYQHVLEFLGVDTHFSLSFDVRNKGKTLRCLPLHKMIDRPSALTRKIVRTMIPSKKIREQVAEFIYFKNIRYHNSKPLACHFKKALLARFEQDIDEVGRLTGTDLGGWLKI